MPENCGGSTMSSHCSMTSMRTIEGTKASVTTNDKAVAASSYRVGRRAAEARVDGLKDLAIEEGTEISIASERDLWAFLDSVAASRRPYIALLDNGNFRAVWRNSEQEQVGLQFLGDGEVQYVLFALRPPNRFMARAAGRDVLTHIKRWIEGYGLSRLMAA